MPVMPPTFRPQGQRTRREVNRQADDRRGSATDRGYDWKWAKASESYRRSHPLCAYCALAARVAATDLTDHLYPHRTFAGVFWIRELWVASCNDCHNGMKQQIERAGLAALDALARRLGRPTLADLQREGVVKSPGPLTP